MPATSSISIIIARRETAHQQPYVYQVCPHALSTQQPYCTVLMMRIIIIDTTEQASTRSIISALSPMHTRYIHARCMLYTPPLPPTTHASTIPPTRLAYFPSTCSGLPATNLHAQSYPHRLCDTHYHVRVHVSTHHAETHKHTSTDDEACCPLPTPSSPKRKPSIFIRVKLRGRVRRKVKVN